MGRDVTRGQLRSSSSSIADHCRISSERRSSFGRFEVPDVAFTDERVDVFDLLTGR